MLDPIGRGPWNDELGGPEPFAPPVSVLAEGVPEGTEPGWYEVEGIWDGTFALQVEKLEPIEPEERELPVNIGDAGLLPAEVLVEALAWVPERAGYVSLDDEERIVLSAAVVPPEWLDEPIPDDVLIETTLRPA
jgi:hypothetical protein